jgi:hypothetical protein
VVLKMGGFLKTRNIYLSSHSLWHLGIGADCVYKAGHPIYLKEIYRKTGCNFILSAENHVWMTVMRENLILLNVIYQPLRKTLGPTSDCM